MEMSGLGDLVLREDACTTKRTLLLQLYTTVLNEEHGQEEGGGGGQWPAPTEARPARTSSPRSQPPGAGQGPGTVPQQQQQQQQQQRWRRQQRRCPGCGGLRVRAHPVHLQARPEVRGVLLLLLLLLLLPPAACQEQCACSPSLSKLARARPPHQVARPQDAAEAGAGPPHLLRATQIPRCATSPHTATAGWCSSSSRRRQRPQGRRLPRPPIQHGAAPSARRSCSSTHAGRSHAARQHAVWEQCQECHPSACTYPPPLPLSPAARLAYHAAAVLEARQVGKQQSSTPSEPRLLLLREALDAAKRATQLNPNSLSSAALRATLVVSGGSCHAERLEQGSSRGAGCTQCKQRHMHACACACVRACGLGPRLHAWRPRSQPRPHAGRGPAW